MERADVLVSNRLGCSREKAKRYIKNGMVSHKGVEVKKPSQLLDNAEILNIKDLGDERNSIHHVGRGAQKLEGVIDSMDISFQDKVVLDAGSSTGGFTQVALLNGASKVYAVDVGKDQFSPSLRGDPRVLLMEERDIRNDLDIKGVDILMADLSFISLVGLFKIFKNLINSDGKILVLIKPQFELGTKVIGKRGVANNISLHEEAINRVMEDASKEGLFLNDFSPSTIKGKKGNIEYFALFSFIDNNFKFSYKNFKDRVEELKKLSS